MVTEDHRPCKTIQVDGSSPARAETGGLVCIAWANHDAPRGCFDPKTMFFLSRSRGNKMLNFCLLRGNLVSFTSVSWPHIVVLRNILCWHSNSDRFKLK
jgi:hypothetical protein